MTLASIKKQLATLRAIVKPAAQHRGKIGSFVPR